MYAMRELLTTWDDTYMLSVRMALEGANVPFETEPPDAMKLPEVPWRVTLVHDADYDRACAAVNALQRTRVTITSDRLSDRLLRYTLYTIAGVTALAFVWMIVSQAWHTFRAWP